MNFRLSYPIEEKFPFMASAIPSTRQVFSGLPKELSKLTEQITEANPDDDLVDALGSLVNLYNLHVSSLIHEAVRVIDPTNWRGLHNALMELRPKMYEPSIESVSNNPGQHISMVIRPSEQAPIPEDIFGLSFDSTLEVSQGLKSLTLNGRVADSFTGSQDLLEDITQPFREGLQQFPFIRVEEGQ